MQKGENNRGSPEEGNTNHLKLILSGKGLTSLPPEIAQLHNLTQLDISNNQLTSLPPEIAQLHNLTQLDISNNQLTSLPPEIAQLHNLTQLDVFNNLLTSLPSEIAQLHNLTQLDVSSNLLTSLPVAITLLEALKRLDLSFNRLKSLPIEITQMQKLVGIVISYNQLTSLPTEITQLYNLAQLDVSGNRLTSLPPEIARLQNLTQLDVSSNLLTSLPSEIAQLHNLTQLDVSSNLLTSLPSEIAQLQNLTQLDVSSNLLTSLPSEIAQLHNLTQLDVSYEQLAVLPQKITQLEELKRLDLSHNHLRSLPSEIARLLNLTELNVSNNRLRSLPPEIAQLRNLTQLDVSNNRLTSLPIEITQLHNLTQLEAYRNQLTSLPSEIAQLHNLTQLDVSYNQLTVLPPEVVRLQRLKRLAASSNQLTSLPPEIIQLHNLTQLDVSYNQLALLFPEVTTLHNLIKLDVSNNQLASLPPEIAQLHNLTQLDVSSNQLTSLPPEITQLHNLTQLDVSSNQLTSLPPEITQLHNLTQLDASNNQLASLPLGITQLHNLIELDVSNNQLASLPSRIAQLHDLKRLDVSNNLLALLPSKIAQLNNLKRLDVSNNHLISLPQEITALDLEIKWRVNSFFDQIILGNNPFEVPPIEIIKEGKEAIINYFRSLEGGKSAINELKIVLVGDGGSGKTSLMKRFFREPFNILEPQTHGIDIRLGRITDGSNTVKLRFWDFGGQQIMHATHQFFLSKRSMYILVLDSRKDEQAEYWLKLIESFGGDSPILIAINKIDQNPSSDVNRRFLQGKYKGIRGFYRVSCQTDEGIEDFLNALRKEILEIEHLKIYWPENWFHVKEQLDNSDKNYMDYDSYVDLCTTEGIISKSAQDTLVEFLNDLGIVIHFKEMSLVDTYVLEPKWITEGVYKVINSEIVARKKGLLQLQQLDLILKPKNETDYLYPRRQYHYIVNLMKKFELCYDIDSNAILVPDLLEIQEPMFDFDYQNSLRFFVEYDFLPKSVMPRFIVKMHTNIKGELKWRTGVFLESKLFNSIAVVKADNDARKIYIFVNGKHKRDYLAVILSCIDNINQSFEKLKAIEKVPMPDNPEISVSYKHLLILEQKGKQKYMPDGSDKEYNVRDLLGTIRESDSTDEEMLGLLRRLASESGSANEEMLELLRRLASESDTEESLLEQINDIITAKPNVMGFGIDLNRVFNILIAKRKH